jgi:transposase
MPSTTTYQAGELILVAFPYARPWHTDQASPGSGHSGHRQCRCGRGQSNHPKAPDPRLSKIWADQAYSGAFARWAAKLLGISFEVVYPWWRQIQRYWPELYQKLESGFKVIPKRWIVERTFAWLTFQRRLVKDYEYLVQTSESLIYLAMIRLMLRRLAS